MSKFTVKVDARDIQRLKEQVKNSPKAVTQAVANTIGEYVTTEMKAMIKVGLSPIKGKGRFPGYKNPKKYPKDKKPQRPVNLYLTGQFLDSLDFKYLRLPKGDHQTTIYFDNQLANDKEEGHRDGAKGQLKRPIIPSKSESFASKIQLGIAQIYKNALLSYLKGLK